MKGLLIMLIIGPAMLIWADGKPQKGRRSLIDSDPQVIYVSDLIPEDREVQLTVNEPAQVYATRTGGRRLGVIKGGAVRLIGFDDRAVKIQGQGKIGWVKPSVLVAEKGNLQELLKTVYSREMEVRELIANGQIALGMTRDEICRVLGQPTKQTIRRTKDGMEGTLEFIETEEIDHFQPLFNPVTGGIFQSFTHTTVEEKFKIVVELEEGVVTAIEESEQENGGDVRVVVRPFIWF